MCGIVGWIDRTPLGERDAVSRQLSAWRDTLAHRGPDDAGIYVSADARVALGHRRLSILDLSPAGHQPMATPDGALTLVFNGEIYNYPELRDELRSHGVQFRSTSDTEVILYAYRAWGDDCVRRLSGMFAFALHDRDRGRVLLARDRAGEKPLFYRYQPGQELRFASELKALMADPAVPRRLDPAALDHFLAFGYVPGDHCLLAGFAKLPPAHQAVFELASGTLTLQRYWSLPEGPIEVGGAGIATEADLLAELESLLTDAVRRQLVADVPVGVLLSGGVDSSLITALATRVGGSNIRTFTITFPGHARYDEGPYARRVAEHLGTEHTELQAEPATLELLPTLARQYDEPLADSSMLPTYMVSRLLRQHATVALGGDGGDELFGGYRLHAAVQQNQSYRRWLPRWLRHPAAWAAQGLLPLETPGRSRLLRLLAAPAGDVAAAGVLFDPMMRRALLQPAWRADTRAEDFKRNLADHFPTPLRMATGVDFQCYLPDDILVKVDRASMLASLEVRAPFLDPRVIEFAYGKVPDRLRATATARKVLTRRLAARYLPSDLDLTRKQGFSIPLADWLRRDAKPLASDILANIDTNLFRRDFIDRLWQGHQAGRDFADVLFALLIFTLWQREYQIS